ncbi:WcaF family extracellular polysaccharide biosynthesis acetyltransferase [Pedobacter sp. GR22-6]|uniref:WcaF family extracellular polysaccharide biosynthesis acetyltransferase n=1 Tax=Pedobacter sp. GR22-6 TaxID=3127957 RepID=UPI00307DAC10
MDRHTQLKKNFDKGNFQVGASRLKLAVWYLSNLLFFRSGLIPSSTILVVILRLFGAKIGRDVRIKPFIHIKYPWKLSIGDHSWLGECQIENLDYISIGKNVCISADAILLTGNHNYTSNSFKLITKPIVLEDGVWIATRAIVCPGVTAKTHSVLMTAALANTDLLAYTVYRGNPARPARTRVLQSP